MSRMRLKLDIPMPHHHAAPSMQGAPPLRSARDERLFLCGPLCPLSSSSGYAAPALLPSHGRIPHKPPEMNTAQCVEGIGGTKLHQKSPARLRAECSLLLSGGSYAVLRQASSDERSLARDDLPLSAQHPEPLPNGLDEHQRDHHHQTCRDRRIQLV